MTIEIAVIARIAMVAALIPRTIIAHSRGRIFMMSPVPVTVQRARFAPIWPSIRYWTTS